jgi:hypothetical protein
MQHSTTHITRITHINLNEDLLRRLLYSVSWCLRARVYLPVILFIKYTVPDAIPAQCSAYVQVTRNLSAYTEYNVMQSDSCDVLLCSDLQVLLLPVMALNCTNSWIRDCMTCPLVNIEQTAIRGNSLTVLIQSTVPDLNFPLVFLGLQ